MKKSEIIKGIAKLYKDQFLTIKLTAAAELSEVVVTAQSNSQLHRQTQMGSVKLDTK